MLYSVMIIFLVSEVGHVGIVLVDYAVIVHCGQQLVRWMDVSCLSFNVQLFTVIFPACGVAFINLELSLLSCIGCDFLLSSA